MLISKENKTRRTFSKALMCSALGGRSKASVSAVQHHLQTSFGEELQTALPNQKTRNRLLYIFTCPVQITRVDADSRTGVQDGRRTLPPGRTDTLTCQAKSQGARGTSREEKPRQTEAGIPRRRSPHQGYVRAVNLIRAY